jgi:hypothetical protein
MSAAADVHLDSDPLITGTHDGANAAPVLRDIGGLFLALGVRVAAGQYVENVTQSTSGNITAATTDTVTVSGVTWDKGDEYKIYKTANKNSYISTMYVYRDTGFRVKRKEDLGERGWTKKNVPIDRWCTRDVFGPGQPEK